MYTVSFAEFKKLVEKRRRAEKKEQPARQRERVLRSDQLIQWGRRKEHNRHLATCPNCDSVLDAEYLHPQSGLCPRCHELRL
jgi:hypothetical protein